MGEDGTERQDWSRYKFEQSTNMANFWLSDLMGRKVEEASKLVVQNLLPSLQMQT